MGAANTWKLPWAAGCRCGQVRMRVSQPPLLAAACHCTGCQRMSASAFSLTLTVPKTGFEVVSGEPVKGGLQKDVPHFHCPHCKSWIFTRPGDSFPFVNLRATMLDDVSWFQPFIETHTNKKLTWAKTGAAHSFKTQPDYNEFEALIAEYQARGARPR